MKKLLYISILITIGITSTTFGQKIGNLNGIYYQAVAVDDIGKEIVGTDIVGKPLYNKTIGVRFTINKGLNGLIEWEETHTTNTDKYGLFTLIIGQGKPTGNAKYIKMLDIPWIDADQFLKVELSIKNDGNYKVVSNQQFMTVPYSFYTDDIADDAITTSKILDSAILNQDIHTSAVDSRTILDSTLLNKDIHTSAIDSRTILDSTLLNQDIHTSAVDSRTILDSTLLNQDIHTSAVDSRTILDSTILNQDIHTSAIDSRTILDSTLLNRDLGTGSVDSRSVLNETIQAEDIDTGAVSTSEILDSTILNQDIHTGAIESRSILNGTILNEDIADSTIDLTKKVTGILPVEQGGTGASSYTQNSLLLGSGKGALLSLGKATDGQIPVGVTDSIPKLKVIAGKRGINVSFTPDSVIISNGIQGIYTTTIDSISPGTVNFRTTWISPPILLAGAELGNIIAGSLNIDLQGCQMTTYVSEPNIIRVSIYNGTGNSIDFGIDRTLKVMVVQ